MPAFRPNLHEKSKLHAGFRYHGYFYRILKAQGAAAKGGAKSYLEDGKLTGGVALVAFPAQYRVSGVMTFLINQNGVVDCGGDDGVQPG
jgi:hypothetical protein